MADLPTMRNGGGDLNYDLSQELHLDKYAQHILENGKSVAASTPTITTLSGSDFLHKLSASIFNSIQLSQASLKQQAERHHQQQQQFQFSSGNGEYTSSIFTPTTTIATIASSTANMDFDLVPNHIVIDSSNFGNIDDLQKQLEYDKFMNDVWIGIVMTLILISLVFCICSCFLYHQFRTWKQNYNATVAQSQTYDIESMKLNPASPDDPVPEYTLVSGLPTYEAALELLQKTPNSCVIVYPSVFNIFSKNEKSANKLTTDMAIQQQQEQQQQQQQMLTAIEVTTPLMASELANAKSNNNNNNNNKYNKQQVPSYAEAIAVTNVTLTAVSEKSPTKQKYTCIDAATTTTTTVNATTTNVTIPKLQKVPSYEEALLVKNDKQ